MSELLPPPLRDPAPQVGTPPSPVLVFDGDCGFCRYWVDYWRRLTGPSIDYQPYQAVHANYPQVPIARFAGAIYLFEPARVSHGAEAALRVLALAPGRGLWLKCYQRVPGYAQIAEAAYAFIAHHRIAAARVARALWGPSREPAEHAVVARLFLRLLGLIYFAAFLSFGTQALGLIGADGVLPLHLFLDRAREALGARAFMEVPSVFFFAASDTAIRAACGLGVVASVLLIAGWWQRLMLALLYVLYLSIFYAGQEFTGFQWDLLLLEVGFLAIFLPGASSVVIWLFRWITFRFVFLAGLPKLLSGDPTWWGLTALQYHFETQPLPTPLAWLAHAAPRRLLQGATAATLLVELVLVFLIFSPRRPRMLAAWCVILFQTLILLTGNYNFFNLLVIVLCLSLFDDVALKAVLPARRHARWSARPSSSHLHPAFAGVFALVMVTLGLTQMFEQITSKPAWAPLHAWYTALAPFRIANGYGLFANMTTTRPEIIIEGSDDGTVWTAYTFKYKPGDLRKPPSWNIPHQPRLDWQMWFAALGTADHNPWFTNLLLRLLQGSRSVLALLEVNPFPEPPRYIRAALYDYHMTSAEIRKKTGEWWSREPLGLYFPAISLDSARGWGRLGP